MNDAFYKLGEHTERTDVYLKLAENILGTERIKFETLAFNPWTREMKINGILFKLPFRLSEVRKKLSKNGEK